MIKKKGIVYKCNLCDSEFNSLDVQKLCSNCFACTGCEIFICPGCGSEVVVKAIQNPVNRNRLC